jgi:hypothetical protein
MRAGDCEVGWAPVNEYSAICSDLAAEGMRDMVTIGSVHIQAGGTANGRPRLPLKGIN